MAKFRGAGEHCLSESQLKEDTGSWKEGLLGRGSLHSCTLHHDGDFGLI
jgi:hypothetical protein